MITHACGCKLSQLDVKWTEKLMVKTCKNGGIVCRAEESKDNLIGQIKKSVQTIMKCGVKLEGILDKNNDEVMIKFLAKFPTLIESLKKKK